MDATLALEYRVFARYSPADLLTDNFNWDHVKQVLTGVAYLAAVLLLAGVMVGGLYLRSLHRPVSVGQADASPSPADSPSDSPTPSEAASPSPTESPSPLTPSPSPKPAAPSRPPAACPPLVITSLTARAAPQSVVLSWTVSGGCGDETGWIQGSFGTHSTGTTMYPGLWVIQIHRAWRTYTDHPQKPANAGQECVFSLTYVMELNGVAPDGLAPAEVTAEVYDVNLC